MNSTAEEGEEFSSNVGDESVAMSVSSISAKEGDLSCALWRACAGALVHVPCPGDKVFYFPQGHIEQVEAFCSQGGRIEMPIYNLPSKILCKVVNVQLKADTLTDEVFAEITLLPEAKQEEFILDEETTLCLHNKNIDVSFCKILTTSDAKIHSGFSIPKRWADECLPPLDMSQKIPAQELIVKDLHGSLWHFRHIYRGVPKRHLLTSGWSAFVTAKKLVSGDTLIFLRGENGEFRAGVRHAKQRKDTLPPVVSGYSMQHGILANALHAFSTRTMFTVFYHPRSSASEFIIPIDWYMKSAELVYSLGTRFAFKFEGDECEEKRLAATIVGNEDIDCIRWPGSEWRCLKVHWDDKSDKYACPDRLSPWSIELTESTKKRTSDILHAKKRKRTLFGFSDLNRDAFTAGISDCRSTRHNEVFQGQENKNPTSPPLQHLISVGNDIDINLKNQLLFQACDLFCRCQEAATSFHQRNNATSILSHPCRMMFMPYEAFKSAEVCKNERNASSSNARFTNCRDFSGLPSKQVTTCFSPTNSQSPVSGSSNRSSLSNRSCTKVFKYGTAHGRSVDLKSFRGYEELIIGLDQMFDFKGSLVDRTSEWLVTYIDDEGDIMLVGDCPWQVFCCDFQRLFISPKFVHHDLVLKLQKPSQTIL